LALAVLLIVLIAGANICGARLGACIQNVTVLSRVSTLLGITVLACFAPLAPPEELVPPLMVSDAPVLALLSALAPVLFAFGGWQQMLWLGGEVREPARQVPKAIIRGVLIVAALYLLVNLAYLKLLGAEHMAGQATPLAQEAVVRVLPAAFGRVVALAVALSAFGVLNAQLLGGPRLLLGLARDGRFFGPVGRVHPKFGTPVAAIVLLAAIAILLLLVVGTERADSILNGVVLIDALFFMLTAAALFRLKIEVHMDHSWMALLRLRFIPCIFILGEALVLVGALVSKNDAYRDAAFVGIGWIFGAFCLYAIFFLRRSDESRGG
jgi:APA family basic amino acid/polyamine antiporter